MSMFNEKPESPDHIAIDCEVKKLSLSPEDVIVITFSSLTLSAWKRTTEYLEKVRIELPFNNKILILDGATSVTVLQKEN